MSEDARPEHFWEGVYDDFGSAKGEHDVWSGDVWLGKIVQRARMALEQSQGGAPPPVSTTTDYALPFVAAAISRRDQPLRILDFGGGLASSYVPLRAMLAVSRAIEYVIVENETICREGARLFAGHQDLEFRSDLPKIPERFDIAHFGSSLHYVDDWKGVLAAVRDLGPNYLLFADLPAGDIPTFVTVQKYHGRRVPVRFWNFDEFVTEVSALGYNLVLKARYQANAMSLNGPLPTDNFDVMHRLSYCTQCIFRRVADERDA